MSARPWNTAAERDILVALLEKCNELLEEEEEEEEDEEPDEMEVDFGEEEEVDLLSLDSFESIGTLVDIDFDDLSTGSDDSFDEVDELFQVTYGYGKLILDNLETTINFNRPPLRVADLSDVECIDDFRFRKEELAHLLRRRRQTRQSTSGGFSMVR
jgi:hypothetical protein